MTYEWWGHLSNAKNIGAGSFIPPSTVLTLLCCPGEVQCLLSQSMHIIVIYTNIIFSKQGILMYKYIISSFFSECRFLRFITFTSNVWVLFLYVWKCSVCSAQKTRTCLSSYKEGHKQVSYKYWDQTWVFLKDIIASLTSNSRHSYLLLPPEYWNLKKAPVFYIKKI